MTLILEHFIRLNDASVLNATVIACSLAGGSAVGTTYYIYKKKAKSKWFDERPPFLNIISRIQAIFVFLSALNKSFFSALRVVKS